jgi:secondary thiamine-phosphate synthase enzyme
MMLERFAVETPEHSCAVDITPQVQQLVLRSGIKEGVCTVYVPHTTAALMINENADPTVQADILKELDAMVPWRHGYEHSEGNSAAHIKASLMGCAQVILVAGGRLRLGVWQGIFLAEFDGPRTRDVWVKVVSG